MQSIFDKNESWAYIINIAGRQRMLSQKIAKSAHARNLEDLQVSKAEWAAVHAGLLGKNRSLEYPPNNTPEVLALYDQLQPHFESMSESADIIIEMISMEANH